MTRFKNFTNVNYTNLPVVKVILDTFDFKAYIDFQSTVQEAASFQSPLIDEGDSVQVDAGSKSQLDQEYKVLNQTAELSSRGQFGISRGRVDNSFYEAQQGTLAI